MLSWIAGIAGGVLALYLAGGAYLWAFQESFLFAPGPPPPPPSETEAPELRPVTLTTADGLGLTSWYAPPTEHGLIIVYFHGNAGNMAGRAYKARDLLDAGYGVLMVGYRGYNGNPGTPGQDGFRLDGQAALDWLDAQGIDAARRVHYGESIGSATALPLAVERGAAAVVLEGAFTSIVAMARRQYPIYPASWLLRHPFDNLEAVRALRAPLLVMHGARDDLVPLEMAYTLGENALDAGNSRSDVVVFAEGTHVDLFEHGAAGRVRAFLDAHVPQSVGAPRGPRALFPEQDEEDASGARN
ncbi:alpha/beta hydrolase [uncultured Rhodospira sp.]|uniref:alpha/beta hydrolase n=1 Tax=uncultured Rhodospira sp. TaxID=1936189 RepID=UPI002624E4E8|nr:alpha/beta hydrolase [uncultured Rhodospira sp.]